ncbi:MAG TPA: tetratricopeptide repeat protein [Phenylobacterium sp.]|uniref:tetratricopeptide repeat protein n=1 Tax=Phenylobacterium sp. TaxID=1871053 RepID=UPI002B45F756|nr:tetratricopeptide repeat protein [Phenylobacterium sp.]HKR88726.1 tetratricopeptide repeat protein [Phenylobacterium sp.]
MTDTPASENLASELHERATELEHAGRLPEALCAYQAASEANPASPFLRYNIGNILRRLQRFEAAIAAYDAAIARRPDLAVAHFMRAICRLQLGDLVTGFRELEWRKNCPGYDDPRYGLPRQWAGEPLAGRTLFIYPELFQGDLLHFARYARLAEIAGARVRLAAPGAMHAILQSMSPSIELLPADAAPADYDFAAALMSLPAAFGTSLERIPRGAYLQADPARAARWRARVGTHGLRVGVAWQGSAAAPGRSFPLAALRPLADAPGVRLISLQKGEGLDQLETLPEGMAVETLGDDFDPGPDLFVDTAAAMLCCDLFVTPDTSVAHLAGGLGVRTWIALPHLGDWRWLQHRGDTPWYPSATLYRQQEPGQWTAVFEAMARDLSRIAA